MCEVERLTLVLDEDGFLAVSPLTTERRSLGPWKLTVLRWPKTIDFGAATLVAKLELSLLRVRLSRVRLSLSSRSNSNWDWGRSRLSAAERAWLTEKSWVSAYSG